jgi:C-terminal processing protease CtpA/Prc
VFSWKDLDFRLKLTTGHYYTPNGRNLEKRGTEPGGIAPDVAVPLDDAQRQAVLMALRDQEVPERHRAAAAQFAQAHGLKMPGVLPPDADAQLRAALQALRARVPVAADRK